MDEDTKRLDALDRLIKSVALVEILEMEGCIEIRETFAHYAGKDVRGALDDLIKTKARI